MSDESIKAHMQGLSTEELLRVVQQAQDFRPEALAIARAELAARNVSADQPVAPPPVDEKAEAMKARVQAAGATVREAVRSLRPLGARVLGEAPPTPKGWGDRAQLFFSALRLTLAAGLLCPALMNYAFLHAPGQNNVSGGLIVVPFALVFLEFLQGAVVGAATLIASFRMTRPWLVACGGVALIHLGWAAGAEHELEFFRFPLIGSAVYGAAFLRRDVGWRVVLLPAAVIALRLAWLGVTSLLE